MENRGQDDIDVPGRGPPSSPSKKAELVFWLSSNLQALPRAEHRLLAEIRVCLPLHFFLPRVRFPVKVLRIPLLLSIGLHFTILPLLTSALLFLGRSRNVIGACPCPSQLALLSDNSCTLSPSPGSEEGASFLLLHSETSNYWESLLNKSAEHPFQHPPPPPVLQQLRPMMVLQ